MRIIGSFQIRVACRERDDVKAEALQAQESAASAAQAASRHRAESAKKLASLTCELKDLQLRIKASEASARCALGFRDGVNDFNVRDLTNFSDPKP